MRIQENKNTWVQYYRNTCYNHMRIQGYTSTRRHTIIQDFNNMRIHGYTPTIIQDYKKWEYNNARIQEYDTTWLNVAIIWEYNDTQEQGYTHDNTALQ